MKLTEAQRKAVNFPGNALITACPGSGKTRTLIAKMLRCIDEVRETPRRIACITYTNAAVYEIEHRLRDECYSNDEKYCDVSTIHAFCLNHVFRHYYWKLPEFSSGFKVLPPDSEEYAKHRQFIGNKYNLSAYALSVFELLNRLPNGDSASNDIPNEAAQEFWQRLYTDGYIDFTNIVYYSYRILRENPTILSALASRYRWILVDEFQDTSHLQFEILKLLHSQGVTQFFLVGDEMQSIYGFAGADPDLMFKFSEEIGATREITLLENYRSSSNILKVCDKLCPRGQPMIAAGKDKEFEARVKYSQAATPIDGILDRFLPWLDELGISYGNAAILAPQWFAFPGISNRLRDEGISVMGPGARPYRRIHLIAPLSEYICAYIANPDSSSLRAVEKELFYLITTVNGQPNYSVFSYAGRVLALQLIEIGRQKSQRHDEAKKWLGATSAAIASSLSNEGWISSSQSELIIQSGSDIITEIGNNRIAADSLTFRDLGMLANSQRDLKLVTLHRSKGREFDAVAIIDLHESKIPHRTAKTPKEIEASKRVLYVGMSRARKALMLFTDRSNQYNKPSRFLSLLTKK